MEEICPEDHFSHVFDEHFKVPMSLLVQPYKAGKEHRVVVLVAPHVRVGAAHLCPARQDAKEEAWRRR